MHVYKTSEHGHADSPERLRPNSWAGICNLGRCLFLCFLLKSKSEGQLQKNSSHCLPDVLLGNTSLGMWSLGRGLRPLDLLLFLKYESTFYNSVSRSFSKCISCLKHHSLKRSKLFSFSRKTAHFKNFIGSTQVTSDGNHGNDCLHLRVYEGMLQQLSSRPPAFGIRVKTSATHQITHI